MTDHVRNPKSVTSVVGRRRTQAPDVILNEVKNPFLRGRSSVRWGRPSRSVTMLRTTCPGRQELFRPKPLEALSGG